MWGGGKCYFFREGVGGGGCVWCLVGASLRRIRKIGGGGGSSLKKKLHPHLKKKGEADDLQKRGIRVVRTSRERWGKGGGKSTKGKDCFNGKAVEPGPFP